MHVTEIRKDAPIGGQQFPLLVSTKTSSWRAFTAVHGPLDRWTIGGARIVRRGSLEELGHLSSTMTAKCRNAGIPAGGQKTLVEAEADAWASPAARAEILSRHFTDVIAAHPRAIFGPDMNIPEEVMDRVAEQDVLRPHVTGLSTSHGGLSIDSNGYTALGVVTAVQFGAGKLGLTTPALAIQGFGAVGSHTALMAMERGWVVSAISNVFGALIATDPAGLPVRALFEALAEGGDRAVIEAGRTRRGILAFDDPNELLRRPGNVFVPAARTSVLGAVDELDALSAENPDVLDAALAHAAMGFRIVAEGANHPLSEGARRLLRARGVLVLDDYLVNCGGLIGCWVEWENRASRTPMPLSELAARARERIASTVWAGLARQYELT